MCNNGDDDDDASQFLHKHHRVASPESGKLWPDFCEAKYKQNSRASSSQWKDFSKKPLQRWEGLWPGRTEFRAARISQLQACNAHPCHKINRHPQSERDTHIVSNSRESLTACRGRRRRRSLSFFSLGSIELQNVMSGQSPRKNAKNSFESAASDGVWTNWRETERQRVYLQMELYHLLRLCYTKSWESTFCMSSVEMVVLA